MSLSGQRQRHRTWQTTDSPASSWCEPLAHAALRLELLAMLPCAAWSIRCLCHPLPPTSCNLQSVKAETLLQPLHGREAGGSGAQAGSAAGPGDARGFSPDQYTDIRYDEEYEKFYRQSVANGVKLPPPVDANTLYSQLPQYSQQHAPPRPPSHMMGPQTSYGAA